MEMSEEFTKWRSRLVEIMAARGGSFHRSLLGEKEQSALESFFRSSGLTADTFSDRVGLKSHQLHNFLFCRRHGQGRLKRKAEPIQLRRIVVKTAIENSGATMVRVSTRGGCIVELLTVVVAAEFIRALEGA